MHCKSKNDESVRIGDDCRKHEKIGKAAAHTGCRLCPHNCGADRASGERGLCGAAGLKIARAALHKWEEPCLSGWDEDADSRRGSGTVFFSCCALKCVFCQNKEISHGGFGLEITAKQLSDIFLSLQEQGAYNINLVSPTPYSNEIIRAVSLSRKNGLKLPVVWNTSGFETVFNIRELSDTVDIWLPDFKYWDSNLGEGYSGVKNCREVSALAIAEMVRQKPAAVFDENGIMTSGVLVRHLVLPTHTQDSKRIISYLYESYKDSIYVSIMRQYVPFGDLSGFPELNRRITDSEYDEVVEHAISIGLENGFLQESESAEESFIPPFDLTGVPLNKPQ